MQRKQVQDLRQAQLQPAAAPQQTYVFQYGDQIAPPPRENRFTQIAEALSGANKTLLGGLNALGTAKQKKNKQAIAEGYAFAAENNIGDINKAIQQGKLHETDSPFYLQGVRQFSAEAQLGRFQTQLQKEFFSSPIATSTDAGAINEWFNGKVSGVVEGLTGQGFTAQEIQGLGPKLIGIKNGLLSQHASQVAAQVVQETNGNISQNYSNIFEQYAQGNLTEAQVALQINEVDTKSLTMGVKPSDSKNNLIHAAELNVKELTKGGKYDKAQALVNMLKGYPVGDTTLGKDNSRYTKDGDSYGERLLDLEGFISATKHKQQRDNLSLDNLIKQKEISDLAEQTRLALDANGYDLNASQVEVELRNPLDPSNPIKGVVNVAENLRQLRIRDPKEYKDIINLRETQRQLDLENLGPTVYSQAWTAASQGKYKPTPLTKALPFAEQKEIQKRNQQVQDAQKSLSPEVKEGAKVLREELTTRLASPVSGKVPTNKVPEINTVVSKFQVEMNEWLIDHPNASYSEKVEQQSGLIQKYQLPYMEDTEKGNVPTAQAWTEVAKMPNIPIGYINTAMFTEAELRDPKVMNHPEVKAMARKLGKPHKEFIKSMYANAAREKRAKGL